MKEKYIKHGNHYADSETDYLGISDTIHFSYVWIDLVGFTERLPKLYWNVSNKYSSKGLIIHHSKTPLIQIRRNGFVYTDVGKLLFDKVRKNYVSYDYDWLAVDTSTDVEDKALVLTKTELLFIGEEIRLYYDGGESRNNNVKTINSDKYYIDDTINSSISKDNEGIKSERKLLDYA